MDAGVCHRVLAIEIKLSKRVTDDDVRQLAWLRDRVGEDLLDAIVITTGESAYRRSDGIEPNRTGGSSRP